MKKLKFLIIILFAFACTKKTKKSNTPVISHESIAENYTTPTWLADAKYGIYTHWGGSTYGNQFNDGYAYGWYARQMNFENDPAYQYHREYFGNQNEVPYHELLKQFRGAKFDANAWADLFAESGAKFAGPVAVHHDNFLMWDSKLSPWNSVEIGLKRDISGELRKAILGNDMKFMASFHHGFSYRFYESVPRNIVAQEPDLYGPKRPDNFYSGPSEQENPDVWRSIPREVQTDFVDKVLEFTGKYDPDLIYFDFGLGWHDEDIKLKMYNGYYKHARENGQESTVAQKVRESIPEHQYSTLDLERGGIAFVANHVWLTDNSPGSWFHSRGAQFEPTNKIIDRLVDIVSKNGVFLLNVGPDADGEIPKPLVKILKEIGEWNLINGEGIFGTRPWYNYGEGIKSASTGFNKAVNTEMHYEEDYTEREIRYTRSKDFKKVYAFIMDWPANEKVDLNAIQITGKDKGKVQLLGYGDIPYTINENQTISLDLTGVRSDNLKYAYCFKLEGFEAVWQPYGHFILPNAFHCPAELFTNKDGKTNVMIGLNHSERGIDIALKSTAKPKGRLKGRIKKENGVVLMEIDSELENIPNSNLYRIATADFIDKQGVYVLEIDNPEILENTIEIVSTVQRALTVHKIGEIID